MAMSVAGGAGVDLGSCESGDASGPRCIGARRTSGCSATVLPELENGTAGAAAGHLSDRAHQVVALTDRSRPAALDERNRVARWRRPDWRSRR
ncbi:mucin-5AC-like isoform X3 [Iris pallida]|uniref:Mucin-5AC-like isoform X3 n=1 Tax=Iris pallida TaxID=29817 RepID=A0AAX6I9A8_IRIPA|nr:mucin-5AC-like isoform X3 [Iris pallida]KAJ6849005.1 mucin-5AC-like isoform X3 [Iris pallida]